MARERSTGREGLPEDLEDLGIFLLAQKRLAQPATVEQLVSLEQLARQFGCERLLVPKPASTARRWQRSHRGRRR